MRDGRGGSRHYEEGTKRQLLVHQPESTTSLQLHNSAVRTLDREKHRFTVSVLAAAWAAVLMRGRRNRPQC